MSNSPTWLDISHLDLTDGVGRLFRITGVRDYACSIYDYKGKGWPGESHRILVPDGFVTVHADCYCPRATLWPLQFPSQEEKLKTEIRGMRACAQAIVNQADKILGRDE